MFGPLRTHGQHGILSILKIATGKRAPRRYRTARRLSETAGATKARCAGPLAEDRRRESLRDRAAEAAPSSTANCPDASVARCRAPTPTTPRSARNASPARGTPNRCQPPPAGQQHRQAATANTTSTTYSRHASHAGSPSKRAPSRGRRTHAWSALQSVAVGSRPVRRPLRHLAGMTIDRPFPCAGMPSTAAGRCKKPFSGRLQSRTRPAGHLTKR